MELAKKQAEETKVRSEEYQNSRARFQKIKGLINTLLFLVVIALYIANLFQRFSFQKNYTMRNAVSSALNDNDLAKMNQQTFYNELVLRSTIPDSTYSQYGILLIFPLIIIILNSIFPIKLYLETCNISHDKI